jgi:imidazolonepropionase-like amidohydrolase
MIGRLATEPTRESLEVARMCAMLPRAVTAGVTICVGDDFGTALTPHGDYVSEIELYVEEAGVGAIEVLRWATFNGARLMGRGDELGAIEAGRLADLLVIDGDPTQDIRLLGSPERLLCVMRDGRIVSRGGQAEFQKRLGPCRPDLAADA